MVIPFPGGPAGRLAAARRDLCRAGPLYASSDLSQDTELGFQVISAPDVGPPGIPHRFTNLDPGRARLVCIHAVPAMHTEFR